MLRRLRAFLDVRTDHRARLGAWLESPLPGGAHWARTFGALVVILFLVLAITGAGLALWYAPTTTDAWASVHFIQHQLSLGWLLRGVHHAAANVLIAVAVLHLVQGLLWGAWRAPRELSWIAGLLALQVLLVCSHTGYLLPWDLRAYWAAQVLVGIAGNQPLVGEIAARLIQGGAEVGNTTLTHLYAAHLLLAPGAFAALIGLGLWLKQREPGLAPPLLAPELAAERAQTYFPHQAVRDLGAGAAVALGLLLWAWREHGAPLGAPADPSVEYVARPEWYFLPIFNLRHYFSGSTEFLATSGLPALAVTFLAALPFLHDLLTPRLRRAGQLLVGACLLGLTGAVGLGIQTALADASNAEEEKINARAEAWGRQARQLAMIGVPISGPLTLFQNDPHLWGQRVFERECAPCHEPAKKTPYQGAVCLEGFATRTWIKKFMRQPDAPHFFGNTKIDEMDAFDGDDEKLAALTEFLYSQTGRPGADATLAARGAILYEKEGCLECHSLDGVGTGNAADLQGWASPGWLAAFIRQPSHPRFYGKLNEMDEFDPEKLSKAELAVVIGWLHTQAEEAADF